VRDGPSPACIATDDARAMHAARVRHGWFSPPQSSTDVARVVLSSPLFFSRSVAPRAALPRSTRMPAGGARITSGRAAHATRAATRAACGESERRAPSELAVRVLRACGALLLLSSLVPSLRARPSLDPPTRRRGRAHHERARGACDARRDARGAWESERRAPSEFAVRVRGNGRPGPNPGAPVPPLVPSAKKARFRILLYTGPYYKAFYVPATSIGRSARLFLVIQKENFKKVSLSLCKTRKRKPTAI
jgi:hypothetical protein